MISSRGFEVHNSGESLRMSGMELSAEGNFFDYGSCDLHH
jgi:hypothetical protein